MGIELERDRDRDRSRSRETVPGRYVVREERERGKTETGR